MAVRRLLAYAAIYILWGGSFLAIRQLVAAAPPFFSAGVRFLIAGLFIYGVGRAQGSPLPRRRQWVNTALLGLVMFVGNYSCLFWSSKFLPSGLASVLTSLVPVWILLEEWLVFRSGGIPVRAWLGVALGIVGACLIALPSGVEAGGLTKPALILLLGTFFWSSGTVWTPRMDLPRNPATSAGLQMVWGGCLLLLLSGWQRRASPHRDALPEMELAGYRQLDLPDLRRIGHRFHRLRLVDRQGAGGAGREFCLCQSCGRFGARLWAGARTPNLSAVCRRIVGAGQRLLHSDRKHGECRNADGDGCLAGAWPGREGGKAAPPPAMLKRQPRTRTLALCLALPVYSQHRRPGPLKSSPPAARCVFSSRTEPLAVALPPSETSAWRAVVRVLRSPVDSLSCALFPSACAHCGDSLLRLNRVPVCDSCWNSLLPQNGSLCPRCGEDLGIATFSTSRFSEDDARRRSDLLCQPCRMAPPAFSKAVAYGVYQGPLRSFIHLLKYDGMQPIADRLGRLLVQSLRQVAELGPGAALEQMLVVPVPMHRAKQRRRGFNHAALLARAAIAEMRYSHPQWSFDLATGVLDRRKATRSQAGLTPHQRRQNLRGAFFVPPTARLAGRHVLLVDDVYTTGATARACSRILVDAGAASVLVATVARAQREGVAFWDAHFIHSSRERNANQAES